VAPGVGVEVDVVATVDEFGVSATAAETPQAAPPATRPTVSAAPASDAPRV